MALKRTYKQKKTNRNNNYNNSLNSLDQGGDLVNNVGGPRDFMEKLKIMKHDEEMFSGSVFISGKDNDPSNYSPGSYDKGERSTLKM